VIYMQCALWLLSAAPSFFMQIINAWWPARVKVATSYWLYACIITILVLCNLFIFGVPDFGIVSPFIIALALCFGLLYYGIERMRLSLPTRGVIRITKQVEQSSHQRILSGLLLVWIAIVEELLFRWYLLEIPSHYTPITPIAMVVFSSLAFGLIHQQFGSVTTISRFVFGLLLGITVLISGNLLAVIVVHILYNSFVYIWPVNYSTIRYEI
jgi:membrane protease YdiL (CAAX protease family)